MSILTCDLSLECLRVRKDARPINITNVLVIRESMRQNGGEIKQPILCRPMESESGCYEIIFGRHRYEASLAEGLTTIPAIVEELDDLHAELMMIDENLCRAELSPAARSLAISRRKAIYEQLHPETAHGGARNSSRQIGDLIEPDREPAERFTKATSDATGKSERTIQRDSERGERIGETNLAKIVNTSLDKGHELDALAKLAPDHRERLIERAAAGEEVSAAAGDLALPNGARSIMGSRQEPDDSLDYFPTPPWATRALIERVFPAIGLGTQHPLIHPIRSVWEPACGEGHIAEVLTEYADMVFASDIHDYGYGEIFDYLSDEHYPDEVTGVRWIITNPPFDEKALDFALRSFAHAGEGVALFVRWQWIETVGRYEKLFKPWPPTLVCPFAERVPLCKGEWKPDGSTATAYCWVVWHLPLSSAKASTRLFWIPPGCREQLTKPDDAERFTAHPVIRSPMTDDSTSKHSLSLEPTTNPATQKGRPGDSQQSLTPTSVEGSGGNGTPGRPSLEREPASVVVTGVGSLSQSGVLV